MAGAWLPKDAGEFFASVARENRIQGRRPKGQSAFDDDDAFDASVAPDTDPLDEYVDGEDEDYPIPVVPSTLDDLVLDDTDTATVDEPDDAGEADVVADLDSSVSIIGVAHIDSTVGPICTGTALDLSTLAYGAPTDSFGGTGGATATPIEDWVTINGNEIILATGWYEIDMWITVGWNSSSAAPPSIGPYIYGLSGSGVFYSTWDMKPSVQFQTSRWGVQAHHHSGKVWAEPGYNSVFPDVFIPVPAGSAATLTSVTFSITKFA